MTNIFTGLVPIEQRGERVLTTAQLADFYGCDENQIQQNFHRNADRFLEGKHFFKLEGKPLQDLRLTNCQVQISPKARVLYLWTKRGTARHAKMLGTEKAWDVFEALEESYFAKAEMKQLPSYQIEDPIERAKVWIREQTAAQELKKRVAIQTQQIDEMKPKATYYDLVLSCKNAIPISVIAKDYGKSARWLNEKLHHLGVQYRQGKVWLLYRRYAQMGYTVSHTHTYVDEEGRPKALMHTYWTQKRKIVHL